MDNVRLILWKNVRLRFYHPFLTFFEIFFPMIVFYQGIVFYHTFQVPPTNGTLYPIYAEQQLYSMFKSPRIIIAYTPKTAFTDGIMKKTVQLFGTHILDYGYLKSRIERFRLIYRYLLLLCSSIS